MVAVESPHLPGKVVGLSDPVVEVVELLTDRYTRGHVLGAALGVAVWDAVQTTLAHPLPADRVDPDPCSGTWCP